MAFLRNEEKREKSVSVTLRTLFLSSAFFLLHLLLSAAFDVHSLAGCRVEHGCESDDRKNLYRRRSRRRVPKGVVGCMQISGRRGEI